MQALVTLLKPQFLPECTDRINCNQLQEAGFSEEDTYVYTEEEESKMRLANLMLSMIWWFESYLPIMVWYLWRRPNIREMMLSGTNLSYHFAFNFMWKAHYFVFQIPAIVSIFTAFGSQTVNHFYILLNFWVGVVLGGFVVFLNFLFWLIALVQFVPYGDFTLTKGRIAAEIFLYLIFTIGMGFFARFALVPGAYEWL